MANYPTSLSTDANLYIAVNGLQTTLASSITNSVTTIPLTSTSGFPTAGLVTIDNNEVVSYTGVSGSNLTGCTRGADGTTALSHSTGVTVGLTVVAKHHNALKDEVIAIETALGTNLSNVFPATATTGSGSVVLATSPTLVTPALGTPSSVNLANATNLPNSATTATSAATASTIVSRDANSNAKINEIIENFTTTATAAGTTTLTVTSSPLQQFTGTTTQTVVLPDATTLAVGFHFTVLNRSTGSVTVNKNGGSLQATVPGSSQSTFICTSVGTSAGTWDTSTSSAAGATAYREDYVVGTALNNYTGSTTVFNLVNAYAVAGSSLIVTLDGDIQTLGASVDYLETNSTTVTFNNALVTGQKVSFIFQTATSSGGTVNSGTSGQLAYYSATGSTVSGTPNVTVSGSVTTVTGELDSTISSSAPEHIVMTTGDAQKNYIVASSNGTVGDLYISTNYSPHAGTNAKTGQGACEVYLHSASGAGEVIIRGTSTNNGTPSDLGIFNDTGVAIKGTTTNDSASAGFVGQYIESVGSGNVGTTDQHYDMTSISLTAGDWDLTGIAVYRKATATMSGTVVDIELGISSNSGNSAGGLTLGNNWVDTDSTVIGTFDHLFLVVPSYRVSLNATTTYYLKGYMGSYSAGTPTNAYRLSARRVR